MVALGKYMVLSFMAASAVVYHAFATRQHFFQATMYLSSSKVAVATIGNLAFATALLTHKIVIQVFLGNLRDNEREMIRERLSSAIMESLLALTIFREEFSAGFVAMFTTLVFIKVLHWLVQDRVDYVEVTPTISLRQHLRITSFLSLLLMIDSALLSYTIGRTIASSGQSVMLLFAFEYVIQASNVVRYGLKYALSMVDLALEGRWEQKGTAVFYLELVTDLLHLFVYLVFFVIVFMHYGLPLHLVRDLYSTFHNFRNRIDQFLRFRQVTARLDRLADASTEDLARCDGVCIICREEMAEAGANKRLHCGHVFHLHCLRSWLGQQQTCPTCRASVFRPRPTANAAAVDGADPPAAAAPAAVEPVADAAAAAAAAGGAAAAAAGGAAAAAAPHDARPPRPPRFDFAAAFPRFSAPTHRTHLSQAENAARFRMALAAALGAQGDVAGQAAALQEAAELRAADTFGPFAQPVVPQQQPFGGQMWAAPPPWYPNPYTGFAGGAAAGAQAQPMLLPQMMPFTPPPFAMPVGPFGMPAMPIGGGAGSLEHQAAYAAAAASIASLQQQMISRLNQGPGGGAANPMQPMGAGGYMNLGGGGGVVNLGGGAAHLHHVGDRPLNLGGGADGGVVNLGGLFPPLPAAMSLETRQMIEAQRVFQQTQMAQMLAQLQAMHAASSGPNPFTPAAATPAAASSTANPAAADPPSEYHTWLRSLLAGSPNAPTTAAATRTDSAAVALEAVAAAAPATASQAAVAASLAALEGSINSSAPAAPSSSTATESNSNASVSTTAGTAGGLLSQSAADSALRARAVNDRIVTMLKSGNASPEELRAQLEPISASMSVSAAAPRTAAASASGAADAAGPSGSDRAGPSGSDGVGPSGSAERDPAQVVRSPLVDDPNDPAQELRRRRLAKFATEH